MTLLSGSRLGPYEILAPLGAGGMGEVYRVRDTRLGREVAVKVLPAAFSADRDRLRRFEQEARAASALNHPNILTIHDIGTHEGSPYVVSELLEGGTLRERLGDGALAARKAIDWGIQIANGLAAAHEKGIVHRDLKPENLFVTKDGRVKILDFGLAKLTQPETIAGPLTEAPTVTAGTEPGVVMGTVGYMSPEQVRGQSADHRSDIFAFGSILYEMLSGQRAFRGDSAIETMSAILREEPAELSQSVTGVPQSLERIVRRCLEKNPEERFQSARDLAFALAEATSVSLAAPSVGVSPRVGRRRSVWIASLAVGLAALLAVFVAVDPGGLRRRLLGRALPGRVESIAVLPLENLSRDPEQEYFADGMTDAVIATLAQVKTLRVISRTSVMRYKNTKKTVPQIGRELGVDGVIEGSVLRSGGRVRVSAQLIDTATDTHRWAKTYEGNLRDVLDLQSNIARDVAAEIRVTLSGEERLLLGQNRAVDPAAHEDYLVGRFYWNKRTIDAMSRGLEHFQSAVRRDPSYALGYAGIADSYAMLGAYTAMAPIEAFPGARGAAGKALELDPNLAEAHATLLAVNLDYEWDWPAVEREYRRAIDLNPSYVIAHQWYAMYLSAMGDHAAAIREMEVTRQLDPLSPLVNTHVGAVFYHAHQYNRAIEECRRVLDLEPNYLPAHWYLGHLYEAVGRYPEAVSERELAVKLSQRQPRYLLLLARAYAFAGRSHEARALIGEVERLPRNEYASPLDKTWAYVALGDREKALTSLEAAFRDRSWGMYRLKVEPNADPLRSEPRFQAILAAMRFPEPSGSPH